MSRFARSTSRPPSPETPLEVHEDGSDGTQGQAAVIDRHDDDELASSTSNRGSVRGAARHECPLGCAAATMTPRNLALFAFTLSIAAYELSKYDDCMRGQTRQQNISFNITAESVCVDSGKISEYEGAFGDVCRKAREDVEKNIVLLTNDCFVRSHLFYSLLSFEYTIANTIVLVASLATLFFTLWLVRGYCVEVARIESEERTKLEVVEAMRSHSRLEHETYASIDEGELKLHRRRRPLAYRKGEVGDEALKRSLSDIFGVTRVSAQYARNESAALD